MSSDPGDRIEDLIERTRAALASGQSAADGPFSGEADDGRVRAQVSQDGRLLSLTVDPDLQGRALPALCASVVAAVNAALDARPGRAIDPGVLMANLRELQEQSVVEMRRITQSLTATLDDTVARAGLAGPGGADARDR